MLQIGKNYSLNYKSEEGKWISIYVHVTRSDNKNAAFIISDVFNDTDHAVLDSLMQSDFEIEWSHEELARADPIEITQSELKYNGRCKKCALKGEMYLRALMCRRHGLIGGC